MLKPRAKRERNLPRRHKTKGEMVDPLVKVSIGIGAVLVTGIVGGFVYAMVTERSTKADLVAKTKDPDEFLEPLTTGGSSAERKLKAEFKKRKLLPMPRAPKKAVQRLHRSLRKAQGSDAEKFDQQLGELK
jgi:hypothetical protein